MTHVLSKRIGSGERAPPKSNDEICDPRIEPDGDASAGNGALWGHDDGGTDACSTPSRCGDRKPVNDGSVVGMDNGCDKELVRDCRANGNAGIEERLPISRRIGAIGSMRRASVSLGRGERF